MNPDKRRTRESFFLSSTKKARNNEGQTESNVIISSSLSSTESENVISPVSASSCSDDQTTCDLVSDTSSSSLTTLVSLNESFEAKSAPNNISTSCIDPPVQPKLTTYPLNHQKRSFQSSCDTFSTSGFNNWKKALQKDTGLIKHALSQSHIIATKNYLSYKQREETDSSVIKKLDSGRAIQIRKNRDRLVKICSTLHFSASQMISFRGHQENK